MTATAAVLSAAARVGTESLLEPCVDGMEDDHQHGRPPERHQKRLDHQEDEVQEDRQREVEDDSGDVLAVGDGHHLLL